MSPIRARAIAAFVVVVVICLCAKRFAPQPHGKTALPPDAIARAVETNNPHLLDASVAQKVDPNVPGPNGRTPLLIAIEKDDQPLIGRLLDLGASVDVADAEGTTPIMFAAQRGDVELLRNFIPRSEKLDAVDAQGRTALHHAVIARRSEAIDLLLPSITEIDKPTAGGRDLLAIACDTGDAAIIRTVLSRAGDKLQWNDHTCEALKLALAEHDADLLRLLVTKHTSPPTVDGGTTPLLAYAIANDNAELFNALLAAGADPNTVVPVPAEKSFVSMLKSEDLRGYVRGDDGMTALMIAAGLGKTEYVRALLDAGADRNRSTKRFKMMALYFAAHAGKSKCIQTLLGRGPTPDELRIEISLATQRASVIKGGVPILQTTVSTGREGFGTPTGEYVITDKNRDHRSSIYKVEMPFFMRLNCRDFGLHAGNVAHNRASHGCIRLPADVAQKLFSEIPVGTVVTIN